MPIDTTYTTLRANLAAVLNQVTDDRETVIVRRRGARDVALVPANELISLMETAHLLRAPKNAQRLLAALRLASSGKGRPQTSGSLRKEMGLEQKR